VTLIDEWPMKVDKALALTPAAKPGPAHPPAFFPSSLPNTHTALRNSRERLAPVTLLGHPELRVFERTKRIVRPLADFINQRDRRFTVEWLGVQKVCVAHRNGIDREVVKPISARR
jgi:hypothetical protein